LIPCGLAWSISPKIVIAKGLEVKIVILKALARYERHDKTPAMAIGAFSCPDFYFSGCEKLNRQPSGKNKMLVMYGL
jgi:hypothetical protein